ncbi:unnamed protein product, partial [Didymodactylos carnosus]
ICLNERKRHVESSTDKYAMYANNSHAFNSILAEESSDPTSLRRIETSSISSSNILEDTRIQNQIRSVKTPKSYRFSSISCKKTPTLRTFGDKGYEQKFLRRVSSSRNKRRAERKPLHDADYPRLLDDTQTTQLYSDPFEELCGWLLSLLETGILIPMVEKLKENPNILTDFNSSLFWNCVPVLLKNLIGSVTLNERQFEELKCDHMYYDLLNKDMYSTTMKLRHSFGIKIADNFDLNKESLHGENSIHIMNQIIVQNPVNDEIIANVNDCLSKLVDDAVSQSVELHGMPNASDAVTLASNYSTTRSKMSGYHPYTDTSFNQILLGYVLSKYAKQNNPIDYQLITIYPGDFHLMKNLMIVIWDVLDGSGIEVNIALDQTIECSINKFGKGHGGISRRFSHDLIDEWVNTFAYRALLTKQLTKFVKWKQQTTPLIPT